MKLLKFQKLIVLFPILNLAIFFIWCINQILSRNRITLIKCSIISLITLISIVIVTSITSSLFNYFFTDSSTISLYFMYYIQSVEIGLICIKSQSIENNMTDTRDNYEE